MQAFPDGRVGGYAIQLRIDPAPQVRAAIAADLPGLVVPATIEFRDASLGGPATWRWTVDDVLLSDAAAFAHTFETPGDHRVTLEACNVRSCDFWTVRLSLQADSDGTTIRGGESVFGRLDPSGDLVADACVAGARSRRRMDDASSRP